MIAANELRLGNYIHHKELGVVKVISISSKIGDAEPVFVECLNDGLDYDFNLDEDLTSITLTEEIISKCGFEKQNRDGEIYFLNGDCFELHQFNQYGHFSYTCGDNLKGNFVSTRIDSLHQLQNLYFALTGKELEVKI